MRRFFLSVIACYSLQDLNNAKCDALCQRDGFLSGYFKKACICLEDKGNIEDFIKRKVNLGPSDAIEIKPAKRYTYPWAGRSDD